MIILLLTDSGYSYAENGLSQIRHFLLSFQKDGVDYLICCFSAYFVGLFFVIDLLF